MKVCNIEVKRKDEKVKESTTLGRETHARCTSSTTTIEWEECSITGKEVNFMGEKKKKVIWKYVALKLVKTLRARCSRCGQG